jgi:DNA helicase-2/ATP-dependent DNA helicase PcrA
VIDVPAPSPADLAGETALAKLFGSLDEGKSFIFEAGAGAGKTHSLVKALDYLLDGRSADYMRKGQRIACITYTNVASDEIASRTGHHPAVLSATIHAFCWSAIKDFQGALREGLKAIPKWIARIEESGGNWELPVDYDLGYPAVRDNTILLGHSDVVPLAVHLLGKEKFRRVFASRYPVLFIDEYQDTDSDFVDALKLHFLDHGTGPLIGFFGDRWQKIYGDGCGNIEHEALAVIEKGANFRSAPAVVSLLNEMRPDLPQAVRDPGAEGSVAFYHANDFAGARRSDGHSKGDLPADAVAAYLSSLLTCLKGEGWDLKPGQLKILMLTHRGLAAEQGYLGILEAFGRDESWSSKEDSVVKFFADSLEPACDAFSRKKFGEMFSALGRRAPSIRKAADKTSWANSFEKLIELRANGTIGDVLAHLARTKRPRLPESVQARWDDLAVAGHTPVEGESSRISILRKLVAVPYRQMEALSRFLNENTPFDTQHGVKGAEFDEVIVILGRGWNHYDYNAALELWAAAIPAAKAGMFERTRNLLYVACSRPKKRLAVFFTQTLSPAAQATIEGWIGKGGVQSLGDRD